MAYDYDRNVRSRATSTEIDLGLKAYMNKVYSFMAVGLALTGVIAHLTSKLAFDFSNKFCDIILSAANLCFTSCFHYNVITISFHLRSSKLWYCKNEGEHSSNPILGFRRCHGSIPILNFYPIYR